MKPEGGRFTCSPPRVQMSTTNIWGEAAQKQQGKWKWRGDEVVMSGWWRGNTYMASVVSGLKTNKHEPCISLWWMRGGVLSGSQMLTQLVLSDYIKVIVVSFVGGVKVTAGRISSSSVPSLEPSGVTCDRWGLLGLLCPPCDDLHWPAVQF